MYSLVNIIVLSLVSLHSSIATTIQDTTVALTSDSSVDSGNGLSETSMSKEMIILTSGEESCSVDPEEDDDQEVVPSVPGKSTTNIHDSGSGGQPQGGPNQKVGELVGSLQKKAQTYAGNLQKKVDPMRHYWGKSWSFLSREISLDRLSRKEQLHAIVTALTCEISQVLPQFTGIDPVEIHTKFVKYICATNGKISDLTTIKHIKTTASSVDDTVTLHMTYTFENLFFTYDTFYMSIMWLLRIRGKLRIQYKENQFTLIVRIPTISKLMLNIINKNCLVYIEDFQVQTLKFDKCSIEGKSNFQKGVSMSETKIGNYLLENEDHFKRKFETQVLREIHRFMTTTGAWVCKDSKLGTEVRQRGATLEKYVYSRKFRRNCLGKK